MVFTRYSSQFDGQDIVSLWFINMTCSGRRSTVSCMSSDTNFMSFFCHFISPIIVLDGQVGMMVSLLFFIIFSIRAYRRQSGFLLDQNAALSSVLGAGANLPQKEKPGQPATFGSETSNCNERPDPRQFADFSRSLASHKLCHLDFGSDWSDIF